MTVTIDDRSGFCFGVTLAVRSAEEELARSGKLYCLGEIVHNRAEIERLEKMGLVIIDHERFKNLKDTTVLIRAHGEPPETYQIAAQNNIRLIDASCKIVLSIQQRLLKTFLDNPNAQIVIFGKPNHPEVIGLQGQINGKAWVVQKESDLSTLDFTKPIHLFSQTTMPLEGFRQIAEFLRNRMIEATQSEHPPLFVHDTVCRQVANRVENLRKFARENDVIIFASSKESSNGKLLFEEVKNTNPRSYFISHAAELRKDWFDQAEKVGICGATSTPLWLMQLVRNEILRICS